MLQQHKVMQDDSPEFLQHLAIQPMPAKSVCQNFMHSGD